MTCTCTCTCSMYMHMRMCMYPTQRVRAGPMDGSSLDRGWYNLHTKGTRLLDVAVSIDRCRAVRKLRCDATTTSRPSARLDGSSTQRDAQGARATCTYRRPATTSRPPGCLTSRPHGKTDPPMCGRPEHQRSTCAPATWPSSQVRRAPVHATHFCFPQLTPAAANKVESGFTTEH